MLAFLFVLLVLVMAGMMMLLNMRSRMAAMRAELDQVSAMLVRLLKQNTSENASDAMQQAVEQATVVEKPFGKMAVEAHSHSQPAAPHPEADAETIAKPDPRIAEPTSPDPAIPELATPAATVPAPVASQAVASQSATPKPPRSKAWGGRAYTAGAPASPAQVSHRSAYAAAPASGEAGMQPRLTIEQRVASHWFVWIGAIAIALGGLLFVKYAYENHLLSPPVQVALGVLLGAMLVAAGEGVLRRALASDHPQDFVPASLTAAGLAIIFGSLYAAYALYQLISAELAFGGLGLVAVAGLVLSLRQGKLVAAVGLLGSLITPALINTHNPNAWGLFPYLIIIVLACFMVLRRRNWLWLGMLSLLGAALWGFLWLSGPFEPEDTLALGLFALALGSIATFAIKGREIFAADTGSIFHPQSMSMPLQFAVLGLMLMACLLADVTYQVQHTGLALSLLFVGMAGLSFFSWFKKGGSLAVLAAAIISFVTLMAWREATFMQQAMNEQGVWEAVSTTQPRMFLQWMSIFGGFYMTLGLQGYLRSAQRDVWALLASSSAVLFICGAWGKADFYLPPHIWALLAAVAAFLLLSSLLWRMDRAPQKHLRNAQIFMLAGSAVLVVLICHLLLHGLWFIIALAAVAAAYAALARVTRAAHFSPIVTLLATVPSILLFVSRGGWDGYYTATIGPHWPLLGYGLPALLFYISARWLLALGAKKSAIILQSVCLGLIVSMLSLELRILIAGGVNAHHTSLQELSLHALTWLGVAYGLLYRQSGFSSWVGLWGSRILLGMSVALLILGNVLIKNPVVTESAVIGNTLWNELLLAYLAPAALLVLCAHRLSQLGQYRLRNMLGMVALLLAFIYITLETKRCFQAPILHMRTLTEAENYAYSAVWLAFGLLLFVGGLAIRRAYLRYAGLAMVTLVILKVFLWDMSDLTGILRILSLMGLGFTLVGIGWLYTRFVPKLLQITGKKPVITTQQIP